MHVTPSVASRCENGALSWECRVRDRFHKAGSQSARPASIKAYLIPVSGLHFQDQVASNWSQQPGVMLGPSVQFVEPCIQDTRIPTSALWSLVRGVDPPDLVARSYGITPAELTATLHWENKVAA